MDDEVLYPLVCLQFIPHYILTHIIVTAYRRSFFSPHYLYVLEDDDNIEGDATSALDTHYEYDTSTFHGRTIDDVICLFRESVTGKKVAKDVFYIADDQTIRDHSLLLVQVQPMEEVKSFLSARVACEFVNLMARSISYHEYQGSIQDIQNDVDDDGVYRGGRKNPYTYCGTRTLYLDKQDALE